MLQVFIAPSRVTAKIWAVWRGGPLCPAMCLFIRPSLKLGKQKPNSQRTLGQRRLLVKTSASKAVIVSEKDVVPEKVLLPMLLNRFLTYKTIHHWSPVSKH